MHFSIPDTQECREENGSTYIAYNIHINGVFHCTVRYRQLHSLHEQLKRDLGGSTLPPFPPKKLLPLSPSQTEERRLSLEKYILQLSQDQRVLNNDVFNGFLVSAQNETQRAGGSQDEKVCSHIHLPNELVYYFALFLVKKEENDLIVVKRLQDFESPYISQRCVKGMHRIVLRKNYWDPSIDLEVMNDCVGLNLLYAQTVQDVERGWVLTNREIQRQLAALQAKGAKKEYMELARALKYYGYLQFQQCTCNFPKPNTPVLISAGNRELNFRIECEDGSVKEGNFKVTRGRNVNLELSFEYLMSREDMRWVTVTSPQAVLMSMCLQGMVQELLTRKRGHKVRTPSKRVRKGSLSYMRRDGSSTQVTLNHTGENLPMDGATQSPIGELSLSRLSERLSDLNILDNRPHSAMRTNGEAEPSTVENDAFNIMSDNSLP
ncbi:Sorting nexin-17 [Penaeus vannamei]|uniref:Sorting nexin-17 n=1 Tax=Penaeus vannamei TaxID=6689 RepID=A0A3R7M7D2_PENVA|nr:Sorting nexin-17 [Penaeus vannamei]